MIAHVYEAEHAPAFYITLVAETAAEAGQLVRLGMNSRKSRQGHKTYCDRADKSVTFQMTIARKRNASGYVPRQPGART